MKMKSSTAGFITMASILLFSSLAGAEENKQITLPPPQTEGGAPLMQVLKARKSTRNFSSRDLPMQVLSNLLWAADGINRTDSGHRTAPSAMNIQEIDVYVAKPDGLYLFDAGNSRLIQILADDIRALTGMQSFVKTAPVNLVYVADLSKMKGEQKEFYAAADTGFISENVYLFCASFGLATVVRGSIDKPALAKTMKLKPDQIIILAQTVGYPDTGSNN